MTTKVLDTFTLGKTPAAIYLIALLNGTDNRADLTVIKRIQRFREVFADLNRAYNGGHITRHTMLAYCDSKRVEVLAEQNENVQELVQNLYKNLVLAELKQFVRTNNNIKRIERSALDRAKRLIKVDGASVLNKSITTYGKTSKAGTEQYEVNVSFNHLGQPDVVPQFKKDDVLDPITDDFLLNRFIAKHKAKGLDYGIPVPHQKK